MKNTIKVLGFAVIIAAIALNALLVTGCTTETGATLTSIAVTTQPDTTAYHIGEDLDTTGMVVTATYDDGSSEAVTSYTTAGFDSTASGSVTVTVTYEGKQTTFSVTIIPLYTITGNSVLTQYGATKDGTTTNVGSVTQPIQTVIDAIRTDAAGADCDIQFGEGTNVLDLSTGYINFSNTGGTWGAITLLGKITTNYDSSYNGAINISSAISVISKADIENSNTGTLVIALRNGSTGTLTIIDGTVTNPKGYTVYNASTGTVNITGGTVSITDTSGYTVYNSTSGGTVNISGGTISSVGTYTVRNNGAGTINISGGTITATSGQAVSNGGTGTINISGGAISVTSGRAVNNGSTGTITITGGTISASSTTGCSVYNSSTGTITITEPPAVITGRRYPTT